MTGIDAHLPNINVCNILASEHPDYKIQFSCDKIEEIIPLIEDGEYDLVLGLSVFHHLCVQYGWMKVRDWISSLAEKVVAGVFELALKIEPFDFNYSLPANYRDLIIGFDYIKLLAHNSWSYVDRPICYASKKFVYLEEMGLIKIDYVRFNSEFNLNGIRYLHCGDKFIKCADSRTIPLQRAKGYAEFQKNLGGKNGLPKLYSACWDMEGDFINYVFVMEKVNGIDLYQKHDSLSTAERWDVLKKILRWLIIFEQNGYYCFDVNGGNFLLNDSGEIIPIDYEYMLTKDEAEKLEGWFPFPKDYIMQFICFVNEMIVGPIARCANVSRNVCLLTSLKKIISKKKYEQIVAINDSEKVFERLYEILFESDDADDEKADYTLVEHEVLALEKQVERIGGDLWEYKNSLMQMNEMLGNLYDCAHDNDVKFKSLADYLMEMEKKNFILNAKIEELAKAAQQKDLLLNQVAEIVLAQQQRIEQLEKIIGGENS